MPTDYTLKVLIPAINDPFRPSFWVTYVYDAVTAMTIRDYFRAMGIETRLSKHEEVMIP